ncbi:hypothetical protein LCI18_014577 [Fusarium solani-melongenae]|uniref:Uncharacterized protein n=1 Tax=Fusarium solani subsp. cucurbitae TaxID=2747967 RepID=A0ACD3ZR92_FUSSC|nr:hypothetical protein LCI18_014577 [Fusarium solani-melongenae]
MAHQTEISDELITKLTSIPELDLSGMIRDLPHSSLGRLDLLPPELLLEVLNLLDFQSLSRISRVSLRGKRTIEALSSYRDVMTHCPTILAALGKTQLLRFHSAALLRQVLLEEQCVSCFEFGAFLFLPTCERVCFECLLQNYAFWLTTVTFAKRWFALTDNQLQRIPIMQSIPGSYCVRYRVKYHRSFRLVSIKQLLQLAIDVHGSAENVAKLKPEPGHRISPKDLYTLRQFHEAPLQPPGCDLSKPPSMPNRVNDKYPGMASIRMPTLTSSGLDYGRLCRGCRYIYDQHSVGSLPASVLQGLVPRGTGPTRPLLAILTRLRSRRGFIDHISQCYGARRLLQNWEEEQ